MSKKSRHFRDESDPLLGMYSNTLAATSSIRNPSSTLYSSNGVESLRDVTIGEKSPLKKSLRRVFSGSHDENDSDRTEKKPSRSYRVHRVSYTAHNHVQVLFQMYGSAFPQVLPFCAVNVLWTLVVEYLKVNGIVDLTFHSSIGHSFMGLLVSFLIVSRSKISYDRFMDFRRLLATCYRSCRELAHYTAVYTFYTQTDAAKQWRQDVCYRTILLLRVTMDALLWSSTERERWEEEYFKYKPGDDKDAVSDHFFNFRQLNHGRRSMIDENFRAPITFQYMLQRVIMEHPYYLGYKMPVNEYRDLLNFVTTFNDAFHGFRVLIFTPYPFSLVQMTRAFLFVWVYTLPLVLLKDYRLMSSLLIVLLVSFGFIGIGTSML